MALEVSLGYVGFVFQPIFSTEELDEFTEQIRVIALHYIGIMCGCTSRIFEDTHGILNICDDGTIHVICYCSKECKKEFNSPVEFAKHATRASGVANGRNKLWIMNQNGEKRKLSETSFLKYYSGDQYRRPYKEATHRDQFLHCSACNKLRRFAPRTQEACRIYHDALARENRTCVDMIPGRWTCEDLEERKSSRKRSGCRKYIKCKGCIYCVCLGCKMCRFDDCGCRTCIDFYANTPN